MNFSQDPIGYAIAEYSISKNTDPIIIESDLCDDDIIEVPYLFRTYDQMPAIEQTVLSKATGKILDVGACAGCHSIYLQRVKKNVVSLDTSAGSIDYLESHGLSTVHSSILDLKNVKFDTIILLMNGLGLAGTLKQLPDFLIHLKSLLNPNGSILCDSTDIKYMYEDDEGAIWMDLNSSYYGEMKFNMKYRESETGWFDWLYVDFETLQKTCSQLGMTCSKIQDGENYHFLAEIK